MEQQRAELQAQLRHTQQLEALGTLSRGIAHDFNNILAAIFAYVELAQLDAEEPDQVRGHLLALQSAADRARDLVQQILTFSRRQAQERSPTRLQQVAQEALKLLRSTIEIQVEIDWQAPVVLATPIHIHQVMLNLGMNAVQAMRGGPGCLRVTLQTVQLAEGGPAGVLELPPGRYVCLSVTDTGHGMSPETQRRIFEPFFTTKGPGEGTGLGLALVHGIVREHEGAVQVESEPELGSTFSVYLPAHEWVEQGIEQNLSEQAPGRGEHILLVDDESVLCEASRSVLERIGYRVTTQTNPQRALEAFRQAPLDFDIVITDLTMPQLMGTEFARSVTELRPTLPVLLVSGLWTGLAPAELRAFGVLDVLPKPLNPSALAVAVRRALDAPQG